MRNSPNRSHEKIELTDLSRVFHLARECLIAMLARNETGRSYRVDDVLLACLCQGAAQHFIVGDRGVQDWDVVFFFQTNPRWKFPPRWKGTRDFGPSRFGRNPEDGPKFSGRRIDVLGRDIPILTAQDAEQAVTTYLRAGRSDSAQLWAKRPLLKLADDDSMGRMIWRGA
jgi:hypothetical protein